MIEGFFNWWVSEFWGGALVTLIGTAFIYTIILMLGKMSYFTVISLMALYFVVFSIGFYGGPMWLILMVISATYFAFQFLKLFKD